MQAKKNKGLILRRTNYGEADRIVHILTPSGEKINVIAKGARREKSKLASGIELFCLSDMVLRFGKSKLGIISSVRLETFFDRILTDYDRLQFGYEVLKKTGRLSEYIIEPAMYDILLTTLQSTDNFDIDIRITKAWFYLQVAEIQGQGLNLSRDNENAPLSQDKIYQFDISSMSFVSHERGSFTAEHLKLLKLLKLKPPDIIQNVSGIEPFLDNCLSLAHAASE